MVSVTVKLEGLGICRQNPEKSLNPCLLGTEAPLLIIRCTNIAIRGGK